MKAFWTKIGLGAIAVFVVGMMLVTLGRQAKTAAAEALSTAIESSARTVARPASASSHIPFVVNGETLGNVRHAHIQRHNAGTLPEVDLTVELDDAASESQLRDCVLVPEQHRDFDADLAVVDEVVTFASFLDRKGAEHKAMDRAELK